MIKFRYVVIMFILLVAIFYFVISSSILKGEETKCKNYENAGFEIEVSRWMGCRVFFNGDLVYFDEVENYLRIQEIKEFLDLGKEVGE